jgi:diguanylate cyclase (GGDEF)-like protein
VPAVVMGSVAMSLARSLALSEHQRESLSLDEEAGAVATRRQFLRQADREWARCIRYGDDGALLLVDPDHLSRLVQQHGQRCADWWLHQVAARVNSTLRQSDVLARFDGAELAVFLPHTDPLGAVDAAERIRQLVAGMALNWEGRPLALTVSIGVAPVHNQQRSLHDLVQEARAALAQAKAAGRNCVRAVSARPHTSQDSTSEARP